MSQSKINLLGKEYTTDLADLLSRVLIDYIDNHDVSALPEKIKFTMVTELDSENYKTEITFVTE